MCFLTHSLREVLKPSTLFIKTLFQICTCFIINYLNLDFHKVKNFRSNFIMSKSNFRITFSKQTKRFHITRHSFFIFFNLEKGLNTLLKNRKFEILKKFFPKIWNNDSNLQYFRWYLNPKLDQNNSVCK